MIDLLYREEILEHYKEPLHFTTLGNPSAKAHLRNPLCGDDIQIEVEYKGDIIKDIGFQGSGCAISIAAASILTDFSLGKTKKTLKKFSEENMIDLLGIEVSETRKKCALLALATLKECMN